MKWRFSADLGTNSLGWAALELDDKDRPLRVAASGSRIFSDGRDPKSKASLAMDRRAARAMRRNRDRFKQRQAALLKHLTADGLFPDDVTERKALEGRDPYALRTRALHEPLTLHELGRAIFHLNQRRGFKSNRKTDRGADDDSGKVRVGVERLYEQMQDAGAATLGEYLHLRRASASDANTIPGVRTRLRPETGDGTKGDGYDFYPDRQMLEDEFTAIWSVQAAHHPDLLTDAIRDRLFEIVFHQRPLKAPRIGTCTLVPGDLRLPKAHPLFQRRRLYEEINALRIVRVGEVAQPLNLQERDTLYLELKDSRTSTFKALRKALKLDPEARFNKESENRPHLKGDEVAAEMGAKTRFGNRWVNLDWMAQWTVIERILAQESDQQHADLVAWLEQTHGLSPEAAEASANARLPQGYGRFGLEATTRLIAALKADVVVYSEAVKVADFPHHSDFRNGEVFTDKQGTPAMPYYGTVLERHIMPGSADADESDEALRIGRLTNPTVHIGLNQLRRIVNRLIKTYGLPTDIIIELARDLKMDEDAKQEVNKRNRQNREAAEVRSRKLMEIGQRDNGANRALLKLWEELNLDNVLDRRCIYSGRQISIDMLFSGAVEVDHILPFSTTLDDSFGNRLLCLREANRDKRKRSPFEAFGPRTDWEDIAARAARLPREKRWRFEPDAMQRYDSEEKFLARQLVDTQYLSRLAREYLASLYPERGEGSGRVWVSPGRLTEMLRRSWGLNSLLPDHNFGGGADQPKNRLDHRHHAIDAIVIGVTDRGLLNRISCEAGKKGLEGAERVTADLPEPWANFRDDVREAVGRIVVSHRPDHGTVSKVNLPKGRDATAGQLHNDTAYGLTDQTDAKGAALVVHRASLAALKKSSDIDKVRDLDLRAALHRFTQGLDGKGFEAAMRRFPELGPLHFRGVRRVRLIEPLSVIAVRHGPQAQHVKGYKGDSNYRYDVWETPDGKWVAEVVSMFDAHQADWTSAIKRDHPTARKMLRLHQNDMLAIERDGVRELVRVVKFGQNGQITLAPPFEGGKLKDRDAASNEVDPFKYVSPTAGGLKKLNARQVRIDELGRVQDPGPRNSGPRNPGPRKAR